MQIKKPSYIMKRKKAESDTVNNNIQTKKPLDIRERKGRSKTAIPKKINDLHCTFVLYNDKKNIRNALIEENKYRSDFLLNLFSFKDVLYSIIKIVLRSMSSWTRMKAMN
jgi:hypothetical protein